MMRIHMILLLLSIVAPALDANPNFPMSIGNNWRFDGMQPDSAGNIVPGTEFITQSTIIGMTILQGNNYFAFLDSTNPSAPWYVGSVWRTPSAIR